VHGKGVKKKVAVLGASLTVLLAAAVSVVLLVSGIFEQPKYLEPWNKTYAEKFSDPRVQLAAHGLLAANGHNMQPWKIRLDGKDSRAFYLYADSARMTREVDPPSRQMMVTQGAFLEYVRIAGEERGYPAEIGLFPEGGYDETDLAGSMNQKPVAKVTLREGTPANNPLYGAIFLPDTNRAAYKPDRLSELQISTLAGLAGGTGMAVRIYQDAGNVQKLGDYAMRAAKIEAGVPRVMAEGDAIFRSNEYQKNRYRYGYSVEGQGTSGFMKHLLQGMVTLFPSMNSGKASSERFIQSAQDSVDHTPAYALIVSPDNSRQAQVESGMLYSRFVLQAHVLGLAVQPLSQALEEYPEMKAVYDEIHRTYAPEGGTIQMLLRVGRPEKEVPLSMRRDVTDLLEGQ